MDIRKQSKALAEEALVRKASEGDLESFNQLILTYQHMAYNHARSVLGDPASAEDATQESFIRAFQHMSRFRGGSFRGWLLKIVTNYSYDILRGLHRRPTQPLFPENHYGDELESPAWLADPNTSVQITVEKNEEANRLYQLLDELPAVYRTVITLVDVYEMDYQEAAEILKVPIGTVKSRLVRARLRIQDKLRNGNVPVRAMETMFERPLSCCDG